MRERHITQSTTIKAASTEPKPVRDTRMEHRALLFRQRWCLMGGWLILAYVVFIAFLLAKAARHTGWGASFHVSDAIERH